MRDKPEGPGGFCPERDFFLHSDKAQYCSNLTCQIPVGSLIGIVKGPSRGVVPLARKLTRLGYLEEY